MIKQRLFDQYHIDTSKDLKLDRLCSRPFDTLLIDRMGSCYACECTAWLPQSIGNLQIRELRDIIGNDMHKFLQSSITDGTYRYCNQAQCTYLKSNGRTLPTDPPQHRIKNLRLAIDNSCNLKCPSCRRGMIFHKTGNAYNLGLKLADKIIDWISTIDHPLTVHIGSDGDPFASLIYRYFMENVPNKNNIKFSMLTNSILLPEFHERIPHVMANLTSLGVSIDGASKETYEELRLGGKWEKVTSALEFIGQLKNKYKFEFNLQFVVQNKNYHEMIKIAELGKSYNADHIHLNKLENWNTYSNWEEHNIFSEDHPNHADYRIKLKELLASEWLNPEQPCRVFAPNLLPKDFDLNTVNW